MKKALWLVFFVLSCASTPLPQQSVPQTEQRQDKVVEVTTVYKTVYVEEFVATARGGCKKGVRCGRSCIAKGRTCRISERDRGGCKKGYECGNACIAADKRCRLYEDEISPELAGERNQAERVSEYKKYRAERKAKVCKKGCPCGNSCIPCEKVCRK